MRARAAIVLALLVSLGTLAVVPAHAAPPRIHAQTADPGDKAADKSSDKASDKGGGAPAEEEAGPPWTYQMAWIVLALLLLLGVGIGLMYWRLVASRQRAA